MVRVAAEEGICVFTGGRVTDFPADIDVRVASFVAGSDGAVVVLLAVLVVEVPADVAPWCSAGLTHLDLAPDALLCILHVSCAVCFRGERCARGNIT